MPLKRATRRGTPPAPASPPLPLGSPWFLLALGLAAACLVISVSYVVYDTDLWQHLAMGRALWTVPGALHTNLWTWPDYGRPYFVSSWGFRALLWPWWLAGGTTGLFVYRWATTLAVFALLFATARRMGARGLSALLVMTWCGIGYRLRSDVRPEALAAVLFALELWLLERHRGGMRESRAPGRSLWWIVAIAWSWANLHISYSLGFLLLGLYGLDAWLAARRGAPGAPAAVRALATIGLAAAAISFANPYGVKALLQPFLFALRWRNDPLMQTIGELQPWIWPEPLRQGVWIWPLLLLWRTARRELDVVELSCCAIFTLLALSSWRFVAMYFAIAAPFVARDTQELLASRRWPLSRFPAPARAMAVALACVALSLPEWLRPDLPLGLRLDPVVVPAAACDFMADHGIRGRGFQDTHFGGYLAWRFPGERDRLPFISSQPEYSPPADRAGYLAALESAEGWHSLDAARHFDYVLLERSQLGLDSLLDRLDVRPEWRMVFSDDAAELLVRAEGPFRAMADSFGYRVVPAGRAGRYALGVACEQNPALRKAAEAELDRMIASSALHGDAAHLRGTLALMDGDLATARADLEQAIALSPQLTQVHDVLGSIAYRQGRWRDAAREYEAELRGRSAPPGIYFRLGATWTRLGDPGRARAFYQRELARDPEHQGARDSLAALGGS